MPNNHDFQPLTATLITSLFVVAVAISALYRLQPPAPAPATAPDSLFSADRAAGYIRDIARMPHPIGSAANTQVRKYIACQLEAQGLHPHFDTSVVIGSYNGIHYAASVVNITAKLKGTDNTKAVLLMAHYDSVPTGPGASDDGSGVATILETLRALKASRPLKNDVIAVFTDGEEAGMMGGQAIAEDKTLMRQIGVALNFEARGTSGPSIMFETSKDNSWLINQFSDNSPDPVATSLSSDMYKHLPNNTDFTWLKSKGIQGLNFAYIGDLERYHSELDNYWNIDESSIQHDGTYALSLTKHFGNIPLPGPKSPDDTYFNFLWPSFVKYRSSMVVSLSVIAAFLLLLTAYVGLKRKTIKGAKLLISFFLPLVPILVLGTGSFFLWRALQNTFPEAHHFLFGAFYHDGVFFSAIVVFSTAVTTAFYIFVRKYFRSSEMTTGGLFWWLILSIAASVYLPHGAYLFQWPLIASALALIVFFIATRSDFRSPVIMIVLLICSAPGIYLVSQIAYLLFLTIPIPGAVAAIVILTVLEIVTLLPHLAIISAQKKWVVPAALFVAAIGIGVAAPLLHHIDARHPQTDSIDYALSLDDSTAYWVSMDDTTDEWTSQFMQHQIAPESIPDFFPGGEKPLMAARAVLTKLSPVSATVLSDTASRGAQFITLLLRSPENASPVVLSTSTQIIAASVAGKPLPDSTAIFPAAKQDRWMLYYFGLPDSGSVFTFVIPAGETLDLNTVETVAGLPVAGELPSTPRPASIMRRPFVTTDASLIMKTYHF